MNKKKRRNLLFAVVLTAVLTAEIMPSAALAATSGIPRTQDLFPADPECISSENASARPAEILSEYAMEDSGDVFTEDPASGSVDDPSTISAEGPEAGSVNDTSDIPSEGSAADSMNDFPYISMEDYIKYINSYLIDHNVPFRVLTTLSLKLDTRLEDEFIFIANNPMTFKEFVDCFELYWSPFDSFMFNTINVLRVHKIVA